MLLETVAIDQRRRGGDRCARGAESASSARSAPSIDRAITAALSADAFARLSAAAGPMLKTMDLTALLAPLQPMANLGDDLANLKLSVTSSRSATRRSR